MFRNIIKKFALSLVADDIKDMINEAVSDAMESISDHIDLKDLADEGIDLDDLANAMNKVRQMRRRIRLAKKS